MRTRMADDDTGTTLENIREKRLPVTIHLSDGSRLTEIKTDSLQPLSYVKEKVEALWQVPKDQQYLYCDDEELLGDYNTLWDVAFENVFATGQPKVLDIQWDVALESITAESKPSVLKTLQKMKDWRIKLEKGRVFKAIEANNIPNEKRIPWETEKVVDTVNEKREVIFEMARKERISEDNVDTSTMVLSAKIGEWHKAFGILKKKPYLVNAIPQERAWSALHQAVFQNNNDALRKLLSFKTCDTEIKAKRDRNNHAEAGMTPYELAAKFKHSSTTSLLSERKKLAGKTLDVTFIPAAKGDTILKSGIPYFDLASSFLRCGILASLNLEDASFLHITEKIYQLLEKDWRYVQSAVAECLYPFDKMIADRLKNATSCYELKKEMIWIYTCNLVYRQVNAALRRASETEFPVSDDLLLSLYSLFLTSILLHWKDLESIHETTYRGLSLPVDQAKLYQKGTTFYWLPFTSSTRVERQAKGFTLRKSNDTKALFIIDNSRKSLWSPRDIVPYSVNGPDFLEVVHPPCAKFCVASVMELPNYTEYAIELLHPSD